MVFDLCPAGVATLSSAPATATASAASMDKMPEYSRDQVTESKSPCVRLALRHRPRPSPVEPSNPAGPVAAADGAAAAQGLRTHVDGDCSSSTGLVYATPGDLPATSCVPAPASGTAAAASTWLPLASATATDLARLRRLIGSGNSNRSNWALTPATNAAR